MNYFAIIEEGFAVRFPVIRHDELPAFQTVDQVAIPLNEEQHSYLSSFMGGRVKYENGQFSFVLDAHNKEISWARLKVNREQAEHGGFVWDGSTFDSDPVSQSRIQGASQLATLALINSQPFSIDWTLADNTVRTLDAQAMIAVGTAMGQHINAQHAKGRMLRAQLDAAQTAEEITAVVW